MKKINEITRTELNEILDRAAKSIDDIFKNEIEEKVKFVLSVGCEIYRGSTSNISTDRRDFADLLRDIATLLDLGRVEW